ncbi:MAG: hypothetical protein HY650_05490 [Acidobacteria bacterium]|nr:hypothetical protein [Acidobacteriota bacterium]
MSRTDEFSRCMMALAEESVEKMGRHLSEDELVAYQEGLLAEPDREIARSHLVACRACRANLKDVRDFFEGPREAEMSPDSVDIGHEWAAFRDRVAQPAAIGMGVPLPARVPSRSYPSILFALAATLAVAFGLSGWWAYRLRQENVQLKLNAGRVSQLEIENRRLRDQTGELQRQHEDEVARLRQPEVSPLLHDLFSEGLVLRSSGEDEVSRIRFPPFTTSLVLSLNGDGPPNYPDYSLEIIHADGNVRWRGKGLRRSSQGSFLIRLPRGFLGDGKYQLRLYGERGEASRRLAEYVVILTTSG